MRKSNRTIEFSKDPKLKKFQQLIYDCYTSNATHSEVFSVDNEQKDDAPWCPKTFDGFACWDETPAGTTAFRHCPELVIGFDPRRYAYKRCMENGTWFLHPQGNKIWTNYTDCVDVEDMNFRSAVNTIYVTGYALSVAALIISIAIFLYFRSLQCTRIRIHIHLFTSFALNNILWIVWYKTVIDRVDVVQNNEVWCQVLHVITNYFMVTSYIWMFCEGLHLHIALVVVFVKDEVAMRWFVATGWGLPMLIVGAYSVARYYTPEATVRKIRDFPYFVLLRPKLFLSQVIGDVVFLVLCRFFALIKKNGKEFREHLTCWMEISDVFWIINVPVVLSLIASFVFLVNVVRVLLTKLHPAPNQHVSLAAKKAVRATLILIPLFGLHFVLIPLLPAPDSPGEKVYQVLSALLTSLQGLCVAVLFCFTNHEVIIVLRASISRILKRNDAIAMTGVTAGESLMNTRENVV